jgi:hypothetical protein
MMMYTQVMRSRFQRIFKKTRGNILAMTLVISGVAGVVALSMYAITSSDIKISGQKEDSLIAYQAASAGIDLGLMYYKFNNNVELSADCQNVNDSANCTEPTSSTGLPLRFYLDRLGCVEISANNGTNIKDDIRDMSQDSRGQRRCANIAVNGTTTYEPAPANPSQNLKANERIFNLKIWYRDDQIGDPNTFNNISNNNPTVDQDNSYQIDGLEKINSFRLYLRPKEWAVKRNEFMQANGGLKPEDSVIVNDSSYHNWFQQAYCNGQISNTDPNKLTIPNTDWCAYYVMYVPPINGNLDGLIGANPMYGLRQALENINNNVDNGREIKLYNNSAKIFVSSVRIRPINMNIQFAIDNVKDFFGKPLNIDTGITHIEVTGYYGGAKRTLEAQMDRKTNAFLGIFDRALYVSKGKLAP